MTYAILEAMSAELRETAEKLRAGELTVDQSECAKIFEDIAKTFDEIQLAPA